MPGVLFCCLAHQALKGVPWMGSSCSSGHQAFDGPACLLFSCQHWHVVGRESMVMAPPPTRDSAVSPCLLGCLAFLHQHSPPQSPPSHRSVHLSIVNISPHPGIAPQALNSSSQMLYLLGDLCPYPGHVWLQQGLSGSHSI